MKKSTDPQQKRTGQGPRKYWRRKLCWIAAVGLVAVVSVAWLARRNPSEVPRRALPGSWETLLELPPMRARLMDIAVVNLVCAAGLPGAESVDIAVCQRTLDEWAVRVRSETHRNWHRFQANPAEFENSEGYFRMLLMAVVFYEDFHIRYNPNRMVSPATASPDDKFFAGCVFTRFAQSATFRHV